jgi:pimeloyl-ACP methyl ester carboxylesterase
MRPCFLALLFASVCASTNSAFAAAPTQDIDELFQPYSTNRAAISPDGRHVAYPVREKESLSLVIVDLARPEAPVRVDVAKDQVVPLSGEKHKTPVEMTFLRWAKPGRLVFSANIFSSRTLPAGTWLILEGMVFAIDADGKNARVLANPDDVAFVPSTPILLGAAATADTVMPAGSSPPIPSSPRVISLRADQPDYVIVAGEGSGHHGRFKIHVDSGKWSPLNDTKWGASVLYDPRGELRLGRVDQRTKTEFVLPGSSKGLDRYLALSPALNFSLTPENYLGERSIPLGFDYDPNLLYYASNLGRKTYGIFALDLAKKQPTRFAVVNEEVDLAAMDRVFDEEGLVFDRHRGKLVGVRYVALERGTHWLDAEIESVQAVLNRKFPEHTVEILDWDAARSRFVFLASNGADPGRFYVSMLKESKVVEFARRAPLIQPDQSSPTLSFSFKTKAGATLTGYYTDPRHPKHGGPPPLIVWLHDGPWQRDQPGFDRLAQVVANMGFAMLRVNYRGSAGFGRAHRDAIRGGIDQVPMADVRAALEWLGKSNAFDRKRVALVGQGFGGYLAVRGVQLYPGEFRCAISIEGRLDLVQWVNDVEAAAMQGSESAGVASPIEPSEEDEVSSSDAVDTSATSGGGRAKKLDAAILRHFLGDDRAKLREISPAHHPDEIRRPVMFVQSSAAEISTGSAKKIAASLTQRQIPAETLTTDSDYARGVPGARARVFAQMEEFLNLTLYDYKVDTGEAKKVGDGKIGPNANDRSDERGKPKPEIASPPRLQP